LREDLRLRVFETRVLRRLFGRRREEVTGCWRRLHNEELHNLYTSIIIRVMKLRIMPWEASSKHGIDKKCIPTLVTKPEGKGLSKT
jgi:hypothetical protein